jgi:hypothetical protein
MERSMTRTSDELAGLRTFLTALEDPATVYTRDRIDIKPREIEVLKREIAHLEAVLKRIGANDA